MGSLFNLVVNAPSQYCSVFDQFLVCYGVPGPLLGWKGQKPEGVAHFRVEGPSLTGIFLVATSPVWTEYEYRPATWGKIMHKGACLSTQIMRFNFNDHVLG